MESSDTVVPSHLPKHHLLKPIPDCRLLALSTPDWRIHRVDLIDPDAMCAEVVESCNDFQNPGAAAGIVGVEWDSNAAKRTLQRPHAPFHCPTTRDQLPVVWNHGCGRPLILLQ